MSGDRASASTSTAKVFLRSKSQPLSLGCDFVFYCIKKTTGHMRKRIQPVVILLFLQVFGNRLDGAGQGASDIGQGHGEGADRFAGKLLRGIGHMEKAAA